MKVRQIVNVIQKYNKYEYNKHVNNENLQWQLISTGETKETEKLKKQIKSDQEAWQHYLDEEV